MLICSDQNRNKFQGPQSIVFNFNPEQTHAISVQPFSQKIFKSKVDLKFKEKLVGLFETNDKYY